MKSPVLVTGGAGFIGSHVAEELLRKGHSVHVLDDLSGGYVENIPPGAHYVRGSVNDAGLLKRLFAKHGFEFVFHLAAYAAEGLSHFIKQFNYTNNLIGSVNLINGAVNAGTVRCFVFTSSIAVYGRNQLGVTEETVPQPKDPYGIAKYAVELDLMESHEVFGLNYIIFRPHNVYGDRQNIADPYRNVLGIFMRQIMRGEPLTIFGTGLQRRAFTHISCVAPIIAESIRRPTAYNQVFNLGSDKAYTVLEAARAVARAFGVKPELKHLGERVELENVSAFHGKAKQHFGDLVAEIPLTKGVRRMAAWARQAGVRHRDVLRSVEVCKNLPAALAGCVAGVSPIASHETLSARLGGIHGP